MNRMRQVVDLLEKVQDFLLFVARKFAKHVELCGSLCERNALLKGDSYERMVAKLHDAALCAI